MVTGRLVTTYDEFAAVFREGRSDLIGANTMAP